MDFTAEGLSSDRKQEATYPISLAGPGVRKSAHQTQKPEKEDMTSLLPLITAPSTCHLV